MDMTLLNDATRAVHLIGLAVGFGVAIAADLSAARALVRPLDGRALETLERFHKLVFLGLLLLWSSGLVLLWLRTGFAVERFSPKLVTKIGVVSLLTLNAMAIGRIGLPTMAAYQNWRFGDIPLTRRTQLAALATLSATCWLCALALGVFGQLKPLPWEVLSQLIAGAALIALLAALTASFFAPLIAHIARYREGRLAGRVRRA